MTNNTYSTIDVGDNLTIRRYAKPPRKYRKRSDIELELTAARIALGEVTANAPEVRQAALERLCPKCNKTHPIKMFHSRTGKKYSWCQNCRKAKSKADYKENRTTHLDRKSIKTQLLQQFGAQCERCGYNEFESALEFHHRNPREKDSQVSQLIGQYAVTPSEDNWDRLIAEASKCDVYCSNCHQALHARDW